MSISKRLPILLTLLLLITIDSCSFGQATNTQNYVLTNTVKQSGITTESAVNGLTISTQGKTQTVEYMDGLGRPMENVSTQASATGHDLVTGIEYDNYGREVKKYLPYSDVGNAGTAGGYRSNWKSVQGSFYSTGTMANVDESTAPFAISVMEASPLNRILAQGSPGTTWQPDTLNPYNTATHVLQYQYPVNKTEDNVRIFSVDSLGNISSSGYYTAGLLTEKVSFDEQQQVVKEFTDKFGNVVVKRVLITGDSLQTYYLYDKSQLLRGVIQPEGTNILQTANWIFPATFKNLWMFLYRYDQRNRMVMKKVPGADSVCLFYDQWDRLVLTQDGNLRTTNSFIFTKYDALDRPVITGQYTDTRTLDAVRTSVLTSTARFESVSTSATEGYTLNNTFPSSSSYTLTVYTTTHYDSYLNLPASWSLNYSFVNENGVTSQNTFLNGQVVAIQTRVLGTNIFYRSVTYYDDKYRVIQVTSDNATGKQDRVTKILSFDGKTLNEYHTHYSKFFTTALVTKQVFTYDPVDRLLSVTHQTGTQEVVTINQSSYDEVGQLLNKKIHQSPSHPNSLQKLDYYYNIRGWLNGINRPVIAESGYEESDLFDLELHYQTTVITGAVAQYNGNIADEVWKVGYDEGEQGYSFLYDQASRVTSGNYGYPWSNGGSSWYFTKRFNETSISYDHNGNMKGLTRYFGDWNVIDSLSYQNYNGNQLGKVSDLAGANLPVGFQDKDNGTGYDYTYDMNGNTISDYNKSISAITYNYMNLPNVVTITGKGTITYTYDAAGNKLQKTTVDQTVVPNKTTTYTYAGDYVYRNSGTTDTLEFVSMLEGRLRPTRIDTTQAISITNLKYIYDYFLKDQVGSTRAVLTTEQETDLYAATMETANATKENALFSNVSSTATSVPAGFTNDPNNKMASKLNGNINTGGNKRVGPSIILKVMTGDTISISVNSWYTGAVQPAATGVTAIANDLLPLLTNGIGAENGSKGGAIPTAFTGPYMSADITTMIQTDSSSYSTARPKAFLNWMVVGEDYIAATNSPNHVGTVQIPVCNAGDTLKQIVGLNGLVMRRNGWIYIYVSNESNQNVYFDNLAINFKHGPLVEQKAYFPFGMDNPALSSQAIKYQYKNNRYTYTGKEFQSLEFVDSSGLNEYDFGARFYDPQIGRWNVNDLLSEKSRRWSPYAYTEDNPLRFIDNDGMGANDWIKNKSTGDYSWNNQVTSPSNTPAGYSYIGADDKTILKDAGFNILPTSTTSKSVGYVAADAETGGPVNYVVSHVEVVTAQTSVNVSANVTTSVDSKTGEISKDFKGVSVNISTVTYGSGTDPIVASADAKMTYNGQSFSTPLVRSSSDLPGVQQSEASTATGSIQIPATDLKTGGGFSGVTVSGTFMNTKEDGSGATPVVDHPLFPKPVSFTNTINPPAK